MKVLGSVVDPFSDKGFDDGGLDCWFVIENHGRVGGSFFGECRLNITFESQGFFLGLDGVKLFGPSIDADCFEKAE